MENEAKANIVAILEHLPLGLAVNHMDSGEALFVNERFSEIYGWPVADLIDIDSFFEKVYPDPAYRENIKKKYYQISNPVSRKEWPGKIFK